MLLTSLQRLVLRVVGGLWGVSTCIVLGVSGIHVSTWSSYNQVKHITLYSFVSKNSFFALTYNNYLNYINYIYMFILTYSNNRITFTYSSGIARVLHYVHTSKGKNHVLCLPQFIFRWSMFDTVAQTHHNNLQAFFDIWEFATLFHVVQTNDVLLLILLCRHCLVNNLYWYMYIRCVL